MEKTPLACKQPKKYSEEGFPSLILRDKEKCKCSIDTHRVQLQPLREKPKGKPTDTPYKIVERVKEMEDYDREHFRILHFDSKLRVTGIETTSVGDLNGALIHQRETLKGAILNNAHSVVFVHNHPSGICEPSTEDEMVYDTLKKAFEIMGIKVLDNIIIGKGCFYAKSEGSQCPYPKED
jgi:DNA repair protein RadC